MRTLVTGASGFVGRHVLPLLDEPVAAVLNEDEASRLPEGVPFFVVGDIGACPDWTAALQGVDAVIHLAARAHILDDRHPDPGSEFQRINHLGAAHLAESAAKVGVKRFVFVSTIGVHGDGQGLNYTGKGYSEADTPAPHDAYSQSKLDAEAALARIGKQYGMEWVVIRPPLVYGPGVPGNFRELLNRVAAEKPLPLAGIKNRRSLIGVWNLAQVLAAATHHAGMANQVFVVSDGEETSTPELYRALARGMGKRDTLFSVPTGLIQVLATAAGKRKTFERLWGSLVVDPSKVWKTMGEEPAVPMEEGLARTASAP